MANDPRILSAREGAILTVTISRPEKRNALDAAMWAALRDAMRAADADETLGCVVLRGAGEAAFSAGADISAFEAERGTPEREAAYQALLAEALQAVRTCRHPTVAAIRGWCMGGGAGIATMCDFRVAGPDARIGIPARSLGLFYQHAELDPILQSVGYWVACELLIEGRVFTGEEAERKGLVSRLVPEEKVFEEAAALAARICQGAPLANRFHKRALQALRGPLPIGAAELAEAAAFAATEDFREGVAAFREGRKPLFRGR
ncbi:MAG: enoyl-CoA hydratase-related protein [Acetobacteraceae bacterium]|nr:enoyl-CoA hydratase-related protein [Acetobacteraceae bacterium]MCX7683673.1 enoyl-CoA hydratase-related protein [Acetobacteraceae bacterium]MDW8398241.1 enoyl-CoA hydratase-related protein [Acetobacteraceae bacterium]